MMTTALSLTGKRWILPRADSAAHPTAAALPERLLHERMLNAPAQSGTLPDMPRAVERIRTAMEHGECIGVFGDYDCDGITAVAQIVRFFRRNGITPFVRLPHRVQDGYGLNQSLVREFLDQGVSLLLTADTGVSSAPEIAALKAAGVDTIVTDHHAVPQELPDAFALLHPATDPAYPAPHPSGAGVVFQLVRALEHDAWKERDTDAALAMIGTIADLVELRGQNRALVREGLASLGRIPAESPLRMLVEISGIHGTEVTSTDIAFRIAPRINASGRIADPQLALQALLDGGAAIAQLDALNRERQEQTDTYVSDALETIGATSSQNVLLSALKPEYPHGIIGLIAGKLTEQFGRPSIVATVDDGICTASLRSTSCYHVTEGLTRCAHLLSRYGGHAQAAGCTLQRGNWEPLIEALSADIAKRTSPAELVPTLHADATLRAEDITPDLVRRLRALEPYGQGNREPLFLLENVACAGARRVGRESAHLQCRVAGRKGIGFGLGHLHQYCEGTMNILCRLGMDSWQGLTEPQVFIVDMKRNT
ncbi:MAG: DHH family phosphoesterase [Candidatus Peribacteraceae bacterium]|nr:DHH family phosphoesterase [Candidatus Peribacteraceae bacterium]